MLIDVVYLSVQQFGQFFDLHLSAHPFILLSLLLALQMKGTVDWEPVKFATLVLVVHESFDTRQIAQLALFYMDQKLHVVPYDMILFLMLLEPVFLSVEYVSLYAADEAEFVLILF